MTNEAPAQTTPENLGSDTDVDVSDAAAEEAEYQAAMAKIREEAGMPTEEEEEAALSDEEKEYRAAMKKAKGETKKKDDKTPIVKDSESGKKESKDKTPTEKKLWPMKNGRGEEVMFDASDEKTVMATVQKVYGLENKMHEATRYAEKMTDNFKGFVSELRQDYFKTLQHPQLGIPKAELLKKAAEFLYENKVKYEIMSKEERAIAERDAELNRYRADEKSRKEREEKTTQESAKKAKQQDDARKAAELTKKWNDKFIEVLNTAGVPKTDYTIWRMAIHMKNKIAEANRQGIKHPDINPGDVIDQVREDYKRNLTQLFQNTDEDKILEFIGKDGADKVRKANLKRFENKAFKQDADNRQGEREATPPRQKKTYGSKEEMMAAMKRG